VKKAGVDPIEDHAELRLPDFWKLLGLPLGGHHGPIAAQQLLLAH
jgi:hypothetical protein